MPILLKVTLYGVKQMNTLTVYHIKTTDGREYHVAAQTFDDAIASIQQPIIIRKVTTHEHVYATTFQGGYLYIIGATCNPPRHDPEYLYYVIALNIVDAIQAIESTEIVVLSAKQFCKLDN